MDGTRFDELTRAIATGMPRRRLVGGLTVAVLGAIGATRRTVSAAPDKVTICHQRGTTGRWHRITVADPEAAAHFDHGDFVTVDCCEDAECTGTPANGSPYCNQGTCAVACDEGYELDDSGQCVVSCPQSCELTVHTDPITDGPCDCGGTCCPNGCFCYFHAGTGQPTCWSVGGPSPVIECSQDTTICPEGSGCFDTECFFLCSA